MAHYVRRPEDAEYLPIAAAAVAAAAIAAGVAAAGISAGISAGIAAGVAAAGIAAATGAGPGYVAAVTGIGYEVGETKTGGSPTATGITGIASHKISSMSFLENCVSTTSYAPVVSSVTSIR